MNKTTPIDRPSDGSDALRRNGTVLVHDIVEQEVL